MANLLVSLSALCFFVPLLFFLNSGGVLETVNAQDFEQATWCIPKPSTLNVILDQHIRYVCEDQMVDCSLIQPGGSCFEPDNLMNHASIVMNLYYQKSGKHPWDCYFNASGIIAINDPSYEGCKFVCDV